MTTFSFPVEDYTESAEERFRVISIDPHTMESIIDEGSGFDPLGVPTEGESNTPAATFRRQFLSEFLWQMISESLTPHQFNIFYLYYFRNYKQEDIARILNIGAGTRDKFNGQLSGRRIVQRILYKCQLRLRRKLPQLMFLL